MNTELGHPTEKSKSRTITNTITSRAHQPSLREVKKSIVLGVIVSSFNESS